MSQQVGQLDAEDVLNAFLQQSQGAAATLQGQQSQPNQFQQPTGAVSGSANGQSDGLPLNPAVISELLKFVQQLPGSHNQIQQEQQQPVAVSQSQSQSVAAGQVVQPGSGVAAVPNGELGFGSASGGRWAQPAAGGGLSQRQAVGSAQRRRWALSAPTRTRSL
jgi:hypothetical protein